MRSSRRAVLLAVAVAGAACGFDRPAEKPVAAARPKSDPAMPAPAARPVITDFEPRVGKAAWARESWRRPHENCRDQPGWHPKDLKIEPPGSSGRRTLRWMESCDATEPDLQVTLHGSGFSADRVRNAVFFAGVRAFVVRADANTLVVQPLGNVPGPARISVRTSGVDVDDPNAPDRAEAAEPFRFLGPPVRVSVAGGDGQVVAPGGTLDRIAVRVSDQSDQGLPGERVWFWAVPEAGGPWPNPPVRVEAATALLGIARASFTVTDTPGSFRVPAEVVNTAPDRDPIPPATFREIVMGPSADLDKPSRT